MTTYYLDFYNEDQRYPSTRQVIKRVDRGGEPVMGVVSNPRFPAAEPTLRMGFDKGQPIFGYFQGGGYAFGTTESPVARFPVEAYEWYNNLASEGQSRTFTLLNGEFEQGSGATGSGTSAPTT